MLCRHSLASLDDAVKTIFGEPTETSTKPLNGNVTRDLSERARN